MSAGVQFAIFISIFAIDTKISDSCTNPVINCVDLMSKLVEWFGNGRQQLNPINVLKLKFKDFFSPNCILYSTFQFQMLFSYINQFPVTL